MEEIKGNVEVKMITIKPEENSQSLDLSGDVEFWERQAYWDEFDLKNYRGKVLRMYEKEGHRYLIYQRKNENGEEGVYETECDTKYMPKGKETYLTTKVSLSTFLPPSCIERPRVSIT